MSDKSWDWDHSLPPTDVPSASTPLRRVILAAVAAAAGLLVGVALWAVLPAQHAATGQAFVSMASDSARDSDPFAGSPFVLQRMTGYAEMGTSAPVLSSAAAQAGVGSSAEDLRGRVTSTATPQTVLLTVVATDPDPARAAAIAEAVIAAQAEAIEALETRQAAKKRSPVKVTPIGVEVGAGASWPTRLLLNALLGAVSGLALLGCWVLVRRASTAPSPPGPGPGPASAGTRGARESST